MTVSSAIVISKKVSRFLNLETETSERQRFAVEDFFQFFQIGFSIFTNLEIGDAVDADNTVFISFVLILFIFPYFRIS